MKQSFVLSQMSDVIEYFLPATPHRNIFTGPAFILVTEGESIIEIDEHAYLLQPGVLLTLLPSHLLHTISRTEKFRCLTFAYTFDAMADFPYMFHSDIPEKIAHTPFIRLTSEEQLPLKECYKAARNHYPFTKHPSYREILCSYAFIFTAQVSAIYAGKPIKTSANHREKLTDSFFSLLHKYFQTFRHVEFYANQLCITSKYLARVIRQVTGHIPSYWIADFTIREAKTRLKSTTLTISQLSEELSFPNSSFFARYFKRYVGMSPTEYRD